MDNTGHRTPPDIAALGARVRDFGEAVDSGRDAIARLKRPLEQYPGLWVTSDGEDWAFYPRTRREKKAS